VIDGVRHLAVSEVERAAGRVAIIRSGRLPVLESLDEPRQKATDTPRCRAPSAAMTWIPAREALVHHPRVVLSAEPHALRAHHHVPAEVATSRASLGPPGRRKRHDGYQHHARHGQAPAKTTHRCTSLIRHTPSMCRRFIYLPSSIRVALWVSGTDPEERLNKVKASTTRIRFTGTPRHRHTESPTAWLAADLWRGGESAPAVETGRRRRSRRLLVTTNTDEKAMAAPAIMGLSSPAAARGRAATL
jgi:hypothetical protein